MEDFLDVAIINTGGFGRPVFSIKFVFFETCFFQFLFLLEENLVSLCNLGRKCLNFLRTVIRDEFTQDLLDARRDFRIQLIGHCNEHKHVEFALLNQRWA